MKKKIAGALGFLLTVTLLGFSPSFGQPFQNANDSFPMTSGTFSENDAYSTIPPLDTEEDLIEYLIASRNAASESEVDANEADLESIAESAQNFFEGRLTSVILNGAKNQILLFIYPEVSDNDWAWKNGDGRIVLVDSEYSKQQLEIERTQLISALQNQKLTSFGVSFSPNGSGLVLEVSNYSDLKVAERVVLEMSVDIFVEKDDLPRTLEQELTVNLL